MASPGLSGGDLDSWPPTDLDPMQVRVAFPFNTAAASLSSAALLRQLPPLSDAQTLVDVYFRHFSWQWVGLTMGSVRR